MLPLVCSETLYSLEESLDGETTLCRNFVYRYVDMWPDRFARIHEAVSDGNVEKALEAALSLHSSSKMVGAARVGDLTSDLIRNIENGCISVATKQLKALRKCGNRTACQLTANYTNTA